MGVGSVISGLWTNAGQNATIVKAGVAGGLRISGLLPEAAAAAAAEKAERELAAAPEKRPPTFEELLTTRLEDAKGGKPETASKLAASFEQAAQKLGNDFGAEAANGFRAAIVEATAYGVSESGLAKAVSYFARDLVLSQGGGAGFKTKLAKLAGFLNGAGSDDGSAAQADSLAKSLNVFYGRKAAENPSQPKASSLKCFSDSLDWVFKTDSEKDEASPAVGSAAFDGEGGENSGGGVSLDFFGADQARSGKISLSQEAAESLIGHLREALGNEGASKTLEEGWRSDPVKAVATAVAIVLKENGKAAAADLVARLNREAAPSAAVGDAEVIGWSLGPDYSLPESDPGRLEGVGAAADGEFGRLWFGDEEADRLLAQKGHQGLLLNIGFVDKGSGTRLVLAVSSDLSELHEAWEASLTSGKSVDVYV